MDLWAGTRAWGSALDASIVKTGEQTPLFEIHLGKVSPPGPPPPAPGVRGFYLFCPLL